MAKSRQLGQHGDLTMKSSKPSKQRKSQFQAPLHHRRKMLSSRLSDSLREKHGVRGLGVRTGDSVRIMRGDFAGLEGKVERVEYSSGRIYVEGMTREKAAGVASKLPVHASKVQITNLNLSDKWRSGLLSEKAKEKE
jgi:large subunit ribosomal protein L24